MDAVSPKVPYWLQSSSMYYSPLAWWTTRARPQMSKTRPLLCLAPFLGLAIGFVMTPLISEVFTPDSWRGDWRETLLPRGLGLNLSLFLWTLFVVVARKMKLHCGGTVQMTDEDWVPHYVYLVCFGALCFLAFGFFATGQLTNFLLSLALGISLIVGIVAWGSPLELFKKTRL